LIVKERKKPFKVLALEALIRRLKQTHPKIEQIKDTYAIEKAGYRGETALNYYFQFLERKDHLILHNIRLLNDYGYYFQIDTLILSPYFIVIVEMKNYVGRLFFDQDFHQLIRTVDAKVESFQCPILQVNRQEAQLRAWLAKNKLPTIPIISFVVISNSSTIITADPKHIERVKEKVIHAGYFPQKMDKQFSIFLAEAIPLKELKKLARLIMRQSTQYKPEILQQFQIGKSEILTGVHCPKCRVLGMIRINGLWHCLHCKTDSKEAHIEALQDYSLLISTTITNKQLRNFLHISSTSVANKILSSLNLKYSGEKRGRVYELPNLDE